MSKRYPTARYDLPAVVAPSTSICFQVPVPNDPMHIAAFKGQIMALSRAYSWGNDAAHTALDVAAVWKPIFDGLEPCEMVAIRLKPTDFCTIQLSLDGGSTWSDVADLSACAHAAAVDEIDQARQRGDLSGGSQQPGQGAGTPGQCYDYDITLHGNDRWHAPISIGAGDTIEVSSESGAWWDGNSLGPWYCPDGLIFVLGACGGSPVTQSGDPIPTLAHMRIIANLPADATTPYFDMFDTLYVVPDGVSQGELYLQPNDGDLSDNQGSINLHVQVCKKVWCHRWDFQNDGVSDWTVTAGSLISGQGIENNTSDPNPYTCQVRMNIPQEWGVYRVRMGAYSSVVCDGIAVRGFIWYDPTDIHTFSALFASVL